LSKADKVVATKGRSKILEWVPSEENKTEILSEVIGRSGNLRAPTLLHNNRFIVGFSQTAYEQILSS